MNRQLPARANLDNLRKQAKSLLAEIRKGDPAAISRVREHHPRWGNGGSSLKDLDPPTLADVQLIIAREYGFESWAALKRHVQSDRADSSLEAMVQSLQDAAGRGDIPRLQALLASNPGLINETAGPGVRTALHHAVFGKNEAGAKFLLEHGADPNIRCEGDNAYPLHFAAEKRSFPMIRLLIEHGADPVGEGDYHELGVMGWATAWDYMQADPEIVAYLLAHGARHNIFSAVAVGDTMAIRQILGQTPGDLERRMDLVNRRRRPLHLAVVKKQLPALLTLLELCANAESLDEAGFTPLDQAALQGEREIAQVLLDRGAKMRLPAAICMGRTRDVELLLRRSPDVLKPGSRWDRFIIRASERAPGEVIETLIRHGASVNVKDDPKTAVDSTYGYTALHAAGFHGNSSAASVLLKYGADVCAREEKYHGTPAGWANYAGHIETRDLILRGPVDIKDAIEFGLVDRIAAILEQDPAALERPFGDYPAYAFYADGWQTPLAFAMKQDRTEAVRFLLDRGADAKRAASVPMA